MQALSGAGAKRTRRALKNPAAILSVFFSLILSFFIFFSSYLTQRTRAARERFRFFVSLFCFFFISSRGRPPPPDEKPKNPFCQRTKKSNLPVRMTLFFLVWFVSCRPAKRNNDRPDGMHGFRCRRLTARALHKSVLSTHSYNRMHHYWFPGCWPTQTAKGSATRALRRPAPRHNIPTLVKKVHNQSSHDQSSTKNKPKGHHLFPVHLVCRPVSRLFSLGHIHRLGADNRHALSAEPDDLERERERKHTKKETQRETRS